ncbi:putative A/G-specific adenine glycosylase YfhQ [Lacunisphaera limnophila]|uniref:Adenine DNA glycosylase n=1 Tax=Lacunisphaera limnophila TaxID=1838286 RepID=A0A1I7PHC9_9BACT|nr:A/G-specific adenine glycosylase [Lacunisphaera limnophila]AOS43006.1 putative A/G-specific adenine glycosylase YfhQ [Lacunisphaera limnophila]
MANPDQLSSRRPAFQAALHGWYRVHQRKLPWRDAPSLYKTVVSEFMLQQTQVVTVLPYFDRWLRALPDFAALAAAPETQVMKLWEGLGYYSRARNLHRLAQAWVAAPTPPRTPAAWRELPGIGPYTAAAITSISFDEPAAVVDGNVVRILARLTGENRLFRDGTEAVKFFTPLADALIPGSHPGTHNQAMMELGATVCFRQKPLCLVCPVAAFCTAFRDGEPESLPRLKPKVIEQRTIARLWCVHQGRLLLQRGAAKARRLAGLHELPAADIVGRAPAARDLLVTKRRAITRFQITESIYAAKLTPALKAAIARDDSLEWVPLQDLGQVTLSGPHRRWITALLAR